MPYTIRSIPRRGYAIDSEAEAGIVYLRTKAEAQWWVERANIRDAEAVEWAAIEAAAAAQEIETRRAARAARQAHAAARAASQLTLF